MKKLIETLSEIFARSDMEWSPGDEEAVRLAVQLARLQYRGAAESEIDEAAEAFLDATRIEPSLSLRITERQPGPGRPRNDRMLFVYQGARLLWMYQFNLPWTVSSGDRVSGPIFDEGPSNDAADYLVAFAQAVDPSITEANCHSAHDLLRREVLWPKEALERRALNRKKRAAGSVR
jgi:hypothetical protein